MCYQYVSKFQVPMHHSLALHVENTMSYLTENFAHFLFWHFYFLGFKLFYELVEFLAVTVLHEKIDVLIIFETVV